MEGERDGEDDDDDDLDDGGESADEEWSEMCHKIADRKRGNSTVPTAAHRLVSPTPLQARKKRRLVAAPLHRRSLSPRPSHDTSRSVSPRPEFDSLPGPHRCVSPRPGSASPGAISRSVSPDLFDWPQRSDSPVRSDSPHRSVSPDRNVTLEHPNSSVVSVRGRGVRAPLRKEGRGRGAMGPSCQEPICRDQEPRLGGRGRGRGARVRIPSRVRVPRGRGRAGRGRNSFDSSTSRALDSPTPTTPTVQPSGTKQKRRAPLPLRCPSMDTPTVINFPPKHPFTETVGPTKPLPASAKALDFFLQMFDLDLMEEIVIETNRYATTRENRNKEWESLTVPEFQSFLGTMIMMGLHTLPALENYWSTNYYLGTPNIVEKFPRTRFKNILRELHFNNNHEAIPRGEIGHDRAHKVRPVIRNVLDKCRTLYVPHRENAVDEAMMKFKGRSSLKQYMPKKPIKRGYKVWCRCDSHNGFTCDFQVYLGATDSREKDLGIRATKDVTQHVFNKGYHIYCDNFFTCPQLAARLEKEKTYCIGTVKKIRAGFTQFNENQVKSLCKGKDVSNVEFILVREDSPSMVCSNERDALANSDPVDDVSSDAASNSHFSPSESEEPVYPVHCFCWIDKKPVYFVNNITHPREVTTVSRKQKDGTRKTLDCPQAVSLYNKYMGGVDMADAMRRLYSCSRKSKNKWYMRLFWFLVDTCVVNAYILQCESPNHLPTRSIGKKKKPVYQTQLSFVLQLAGQLIKKHSSRKVAGRQPIMPESESRYTKHVPCKYDKPRRCKVCTTPTKKHQTLFGCEECGVPLCIYPCYGVFHS